MSTDLFLVPVTYPEFERTVISPVDLKELSVRQSTRNEIDQPEGVRVWGVKNSQLNKKFYHKMSENDYLLFYHNDKYRHFGKVGQKFRSDVISKRFWGGISADMLYTINSFNNINFSRERLNSICEYKKSYQPQSIRRISNKAYRRLKREYGDINLLVAESDDESES